MKKSKCIILIFMTAVLLLGGCSNVADEKKIQSDLETNTQFAFLEDGEKIEEIIIEKRQTDKEQKTDTIWCTITTEDAEISYQKNVVLTYGLYDKGGWILDNISVNETMQTPLAGIAEENIAASLSNKYITINNENWEITKTNIKGISIESHDTNLEEKSDTVTANLILAEEVEEASGKIEIQYQFDNGWKTDTVSVIEDFVITVKPEKALNVTEEDLTNLLDGQTFEYGESKSKQVITISKNEITDFAVENQSSSSKGIYQKLDCRCVLTTQYVTFDLQIEIQYSYGGDNGWQLSSVTIFPEAASVNLEGDWTGSYVAAGDRGEVVLSISNMDEAGNIEGIYSWTSDWQTGSYHVSGTLDKDTFLLSLAAGEWIDEPSHATFVTKTDIGAIFYVDDCKLEGIGHQSASFKVSQ